MGKYILFDPITCERRDTTYEEMINITGRSFENLATSKTRKIKIKSINCYFLNADISKKELRELIAKEKIEDEMFLDIPGTNGLYQASNYGRIKSNYIKDKNNFLVLYKRNKANRSKHVKWLFAHVKMNGKMKEFTVHRLVAMTFLGIESSDKVVVHKNRILHDNRVCNLEYIEKKQLVKFTRLSHPMPIAKLDKDTLEVLEEYTSMAEAARQNFLHKATIPHCLKRQNGYAGGFKWKVIEE